MSGQNYLPINIVIYTAKRGCLDTAEYKRRVIFRNSSIAYHGKKTFFNAVMEGKKIKGTCLCGRAR